MMRMAEKLGFISVYLSASSVNLCGLSSHLLSKQEKIGESGR
jgi:hypothetical protein